VSRGAAAALGLGLLALLPVARFAAHADPVRGERVFLRCYACHSVLAGEENLPGPSLRCVLGRRAGTLPGFRYSSAMIDAGSARGLVWTRATLDTFLVDPRRLVPETAMSIPGLPAAEDRRDVIDYLERAGPCASAAPTPMPR
jgi:cytochrome c